MTANQKNDRTSLSVFSIVLTLVLVAIVLISVRAIIHRDPPPTVASLMVELEIPADVPADALQEQVQEIFLTRFGEIYGIDPEPVETAYFTKLLKENPVEMRMEEYLSEAVRKECARRSIPEETLIRRVLKIRNPEEKEQIRKEWTAAGTAAVLESEAFIKAMEPVYEKFYAWWTGRHPEYDGIAAGISITDDHEALVHQLAVSLRRELLVRMAQQLEIRLETDLRKRGKAISEAKRKKALSVFLRLSRERYTEDMTLRMAEAIVRETELTDDEILHCMLLKNLPLSEDRLTKIQDIQERFITPRALDEIPAETISSIRKDLEEITGVEYGTK